MTSIKMILSDIDGTLLNDEADLLPSTITGLKKAAAQGAQIVLASARSPKGMFGLAQQLGVHSTMIAYNGALTAATDAADHLTVMEQQPIPLAAAQAVQKVVAQRWPEASLNIYTNNDWYVEQVAAWEEQEADGIGYQPTITPLATWLATPQTPIHKLMIMAPASTISAIEPLLKSPEFADLDVYRSKPTYLEIVATGVSKAAALKKLLVDEKVATKQTMAFGDNFNDVAMLQTVGIGVAMGNAPQAVKDAADIVTLDNNHDGIAKVLQVYFD